MRYRVRLLGKREDQLGVRRDRALQETVCMIKQNSGVEMRAVTSAPIVLGHGTATVPLIGSVSDCSRRIASNISRWTGQVRLHLSPFLVSLSLDAKWREGGGNISCLPEIWKGEIWSFAVFAPFFPFFGTAGY